MPKGAESRYRRAIIFCDVSDLSVQKLKSSLEYCGFQVHRLNLESLLLTLRKSTKNFITFKMSLTTKCPFPVSLCGLISDEDWLLVFVIAPIKKSHPGDGNAELTVEIGKELVTIQQITGLFVGSKCATYAEKPKVFFFLHFEAWKKEDGLLSVNFSFVTLILLDKIFIDLF